MSPSLYIRVKTHAGAWRYRRVREGRGVKTGDLTAPFFARPCVRGKQVWKTLHAGSLQEAKVEALHLNVALDAQARGLTVVEAENLGEANRVGVAVAIERYMEQKSGKAVKTVMQYRLTLNKFREAIGTRVRFLDEITENVLRSYKNYMVEQGYAGKTIDTRINIVYFLLKKNGIAARIPKDEMPVVEEEVAVPYSEEELQKLFGAMDGEEALVYKFFLASGCRNREVTFAAWNDIDFDKKMFHIRRKEDVQFTPKSHESRTVPLPDSLVALLKARRKKALHDRWIFVNEEGRPDNHFLRKLKRIALRAGLNCGQCKTKITVGRYHKSLVDVCCKNQPVCDHVYLHRLRKTCASRWEQSGVPIRTVQSFLGHKNLETTMIYLGVADIETLRGNINRAFGD